MRRKNLMTALVCTFCVAVSSTAPMAVMAEETETVTEAVEESTEATTETQDGEDTEETEAMPERPDYTAGDYVTLGEYKGLTVTEQATEVTDEEIQEEVEYNIQLADAMETVTEGAVRDGDTANIDYEGKLNGEAFDGGTAKGYDLQIGSGTFIDGFEDGLVGVEVGETVDLPLTFPENYGSEDLAGQDVIFTVTVNEIKRMPELSDELVNTISDGEYSDVASYRDSIRASLEAEKESQKEYLMKSDLLTQVANVSEIKEYPQKMVDYGMDNMEIYYKSMAESYSMEFADFLTTYFGMTEEEFKEQAEAAVKQNLQQELYLKAIAEAEGLEISDEDYAAGCEDYAQQYGFESADALVAAYGEDTVRVSILQDKVLDFLLDNAVIETEAETEAESGTDAAEETETEE